METSEIYSNIPMRTWRWLGVNEIKQPEGIKTAGKLPRQQITLHHQCTDFCLRVPQLCQHSASQKARRSRNQIFLKHPITSKTKDRC